MPSSTTTSPRVSMMPGLFKTPQGQTLCVFCAEEAQSRGQLGLSATSRGRLSYNRAAVCSGCGDVLTKGRWRDPKLEV